MTSSTFDIGPRGSRFDKILWDGLFGLNTSVKFQLRSSTDTLLLKNSKWYGPTDTLSYYSTDEGQQINQIHNGDRFIQYRAFFNTSSINITPVLNSVSIGYIPNDTLAPASPQNFTSKAEHSSIKLSWTPNSESDLARYIIYKGTESKNYIPQWTVEVPASISSYKDTLVVTGKTYYYCIIALDSAWNMSSSAKEISGTPAAINIYVSYKGNDLNDGSENTPFLTISKAIAAAKYGDNVMVLPGLYNEVITMKKGVSLTGAGAQYTKILQTTPNSYGIYGASDASLTGFTIEVNKQDSYAAINTNNSSLKIFDNRIIYTGSIGTYAPGIQTRDTSNSEICRNFIDGFTVGILAHSLAHQKIRNNIIRAAQVGIEIPGYISSEITNNTIIGPRVRGIYFDNPQTVVKNNIIYGLDSTFTVGINTGSFNQGYDVSYNDVWNCRTKYNLNTPGTGNLVKDPLFINPDTQNFGLMAGSPCIDTGDPASAFNDIDGSRNDMGAYGGPDPIKSNVFLELVKAISVSKVSAFPGDTLSIALKMDNLSGILKGTFTLKFNSGTLTYLDASKTKATENFDLKASLVGDNLNICLTGNKAIESINKDLIIFRFVASKNAAGLTSPISVINASFMDNALNSIYIKSISDGLVSVGNVSNSKNAIYVGISPNSKEDGSYINPYSSIQRAIDNAKYGDTVYVAGGEYTENLKMKEGVSVIGSGAVLTTLIQKQNARAVDFINISKGELSGFTIKGNEYDPSINALVMMSNSSACFFRNVIDCREHPSMGIWIDDHSIPRIENNSFMSAGTTIRKSAPIIKNNHMLLEGALESNIFISDSSTPSIIANKIRVSQSSLNVGNASAIIKNNRITILNGPECIMLNRSNNVTIQNNIIEDQGDGAKAIWIFDSQNLSVINNTITSKAAGIQESGSTGSIMNNIITGSLLNGVSLSTSAMLQYNNVWGNKTNYFNISAGATDIQADPVFTGSNYMLSSTSPCINAGNPATEY
ncbi:MAG TPA: right-handed parallel beta-helix repeat-containing protein, partial [Bacteroidales bacterium]|nr:right-handed parallel beta-helix repeat-containing protein [Bacteroidales bacterium]